VPSKPGGQDQSERDQPEANPRQHKDESRRKQAGDGRRTCCCTQHVRGQPSGQSGGPGDAEPALKQTATAPRTGPTVVLGRVTKDPEPIVLRPDPGDFDRPAGQEGDSRPPGTFDNARDIAKLVERRDQGGLELLDRPALSWSRPERQVDAPPKFPGKVPALTAKRGQMRAKPGRPSTVDRDGVDARQRLVEH
jgi:hypothetical protein